MQMNEHENSPDSDAGHPMPSETNHDPLPGPAAGIAFVGTSGDEPALPPDYEDKNQLAHRLGVSRRTIDAMVAERLLPFVRIGRKIIRFNRRDVDAHLARRHRVAARGE